MGACSTQKLVEIHNIQVQYRLTLKLKLLKKFSLTACGSYFSNSMGVITSPGYPVSYGSRLTCQWVVRVRPGRKIQFEFTDLDVTSTDAMCQQDYLTVSLTLILIINRQNQIIC